MSYTVDVILPEVPRGTDVYAFRDRLLDEQAKRLDVEDAPPFEEASPAFAELHRRLTARYPCICDDDAGPWSDGPLINNFGQEIATLGISYSRVAEVLPFLIETALAMGFSVVDGQDDKIHRPGGTVESISSN